MGNKGDKTKQDIRREAASLFSQHGYKEVTMKDICDKTGLSRGGLYRHYDSTSQIFLEIIREFNENQGDFFQDKMGKNISATEILEEILKQYEKEMIDQESSLSIAIYEYFSNPLISKSDNSVAKQYHDSKSMWVNFIQYGIENREFYPVNPESIFNLIVFSYQGVRMYSKLMEIDPAIPAMITKEIKTLLLARKEN